MALTLWWLAAALALVVGPAAAKIDLMEPNFVAGLLGTYGRPVTSIRFFPDGQILFAMKQGLLYIGNVSQQPFRPQVYFTVPSTNSFNERGLLDVVFHPSFPATPHLFIAYTKENPRRLTVARLTHRVTVVNGVTRMDATGMTEIWMSQAFSECCHIAGALSFGPDRMLYLTTGDNTNTSLSEDVSSFAGKVLRMTTAGAPVSGNAGMADGPGGMYDFIWARGLRNPYRASWDLPSNRLFIGDVGGNTVSSSWEDIFIGVPGGNFGWPSCEGPCFDKNKAQSRSCLCTTGAHLTPAYSYPQAQGGTGGCIIGGFVYRGASFPDKFRGSYFFGDYIRQTINYLPFDPVLPRPLSSKPPLHPPVLLAAVGIARPTCLSEVSSTSQQ